MTDRNIQPIPAATESDRNIQLIPLVPVPEAPHITVPDFADFRARLSHDAANFQRDNADLIARGKIPGLDLTHKGLSPNSTSEKTLSNGHRLKLNFDDNANLESVVISDKTGPIDVASIKAGKVVMEGVKADDSVVRYDLNSTGQIARQTIASGGLLETLDLDGSGKVAHASDLLPSGMKTEVKDSPGEHVYRQVLPSGETLEFRYDDQLKFTSGTDSRDGKLWIFSPGKNGGLNIAPGSEA